MCIRTCVCVSAQQVKEKQAVNLQAGKCQVHDTSKGAHFSAQGKIKKWLGDAATKSTGQDFQAFTSEAFRQSVCRLHQPKSSTRVA
jgi:hypothetical protein